MTRGARSSCRGHLCCKCRIGGSQEVWQGQGMGAAAKSDAALQMQCRVCSRGAGWEQQLVGTLGCRCSLRAAPDGAGWWEGVGWRFVELLGAELQLQLRRYVKELGRGRGCKQQLVGMPGCSSSPTGIAGVVMGVGSHNQQQQGNCWSCSCSFFSAPEHGKSLQSMVAGGTLRWCLSVVVKACAAVV
jgi:hypothetical protein